MDQQPVVVPTLPGAWALIVRAWKIYTTTWNAQVRVSMPLVYLGLAYLVTGVLVQYVSSGFSAVAFLLGLCGWFLTLWIQFRVLVNALHLHDGKTPITMWPPAQESDKAWLLFFATILISIIQFFLTLGGYILFIIPGIYLSIAFAFSQVIRIDQGEMKSMEALKKSRLLVQGRWWATLWRLFAGNVVLGLPFILILGVALIGSFLLTAMLNVGPVDNIETNYAIQGIYQALEYVIAALSLPLFSTFTVTLYRALSEKKS